MYFNHTIAYACYDHLKNIMYFIYSLYSISNMGYISQTA